MKIRIEALRKTAARVLLRSGKIKKEDVEKILDVLLFADMTGRSTQGVIKLIGTEPLQAVTSDGKIEILKQNAVSAQIDAHRNPAPLATYVATEKVIEKCRASGIGIVGLKDFYTSNGAQAYYVNKIAQSGFVGIAASRSPGAIAPHGGREPLFGTNPIAFGFPTLEEPLLFDMASSAITWYGLVQAKAEGKKIPSDVAMDKDGVVTTDPNEAMEGAIFPFDRSYKGAGIAMVIELLAGPLVGASFCNVDAREKDWGTFILAIDPEIFGDRELFKQSASELINIVRDSKPRMTGGVVSLPGDRSRSLYKAAMISGEVEISDAVLKELKELAQR